jgi:hypothetical protein
MQELLRTQKQNYLRTHVLEQGFEPEDFAHALGKRKKAGKINLSGEDIDNWTMNELETLVDLYKREQDKPGLPSKYKLQDIDLEVVELH